MDSVQAIINSINPFGRSESPGEIQVEQQPRAALSEQDMGFDPVAESTEPKVPERTEDAIESRLRQNKELFESLAKAEQPSRLAGYTDKTPRGKGKGKGIAKLAANFEQRAGSAASSQSSISMVSSRMTPLHGYKGPAPQLTSALVFDASRVGTPRSLPPPATPTSMPPDESSGSSAAIAAPGTPLSMPPEEDDDYTPDFGLQVPTQSRMPSLVRPQSLGYEIHLAELKPSTELQTYSVPYFSLLVARLAAVVELYPCRYEVHACWPSDLVFDAGPRERCQGKAAAAGALVA